MKAPRILWVDCLGGLAVGAAMLILREWISPWYGLPLGLLTAMALANLLYGCYSLSLVLRSRRTRGMIRLLVLANAGWAVFCLAAAFAMARQASGFGLAHLLLEGLYVGGLAALEWRQRERLTSRTQGDRLI